MKRINSHTGRIGAQLCLIALCVMIMVFAFNLSTFLAVAAGQVFAGIWISFAIIMFAAHSVELLPKMKKPAAIIRRDAHNRKNLLQTRIMQG